MMGGKLAHEFMYLTPIGEDTLLLCDSCGYAANREVAQISKDSASSETPRLALEKIETPHTTTIEALAKFLGKPASETAKAVFLVATISADGQDREQFVLVIVRGDMEVNEIKLGNAVQAKALRPATEAEILAVKAVPGYGSAIGVENALVVVDDLIPLSPNLVAGANEAGYHLLNTNYGRDYSADIVADIVSAREGDGCPQCGQPLRTVRGVEVGNIFKLGTRYSDALGCTFLDSEGKTQPVIMGSYGIGVGRLLACVAEQHHDEHGLMLPISIAPYQVHLVGLLDGTDGVSEAAEAVYDRLQRAGFEVLYDDRQERPGVKFNDADLIGCPLRLTVSKKSLESGGVELKRRDSSEKSVVALAEVLDHVRGELDALWAALNEQVVNVAYPDD